MICRRKSSVYAIKSVNLSNVIVSNYGHCDGFCRCASLHMDRKFGKLKAKKLTIPKTIPQKIEIQEGFIKQAVYLKRTRRLNSKWQEDGPRSSLVIQKKGIITFSYLHIQ